MAIGNINYMKDVAAFCGNEAQNGHAGPFSHLVGTNLVQQNFLTKV